MTAAPELFTQNQLRDVFNYHLINATEKIDSIPRDIFRSPLARVLLAELLATERQFDNENPKTAAVLNRAADEIARALGEQLPVVGTMTEKPLVTEVDSKAVDQIQAADIAAGWAREALETNAPSTLGAMFERVWINGQRIK